MGWRSSTCLFYCMPLVSDFVVAVKTVTFIPGSIPGSSAGRQCADFTILSDTFVEGLESFTVTGTGGYFPGGNYVAVEITDDDS